MNVRVSKAVSWQCDTLILNCFVLGYNFQNQLITSFNFRLGFADETNMDTFFNIEFHLSLFAQLFFSIQVSLQPSRTLIVCYTCVNYTIICKQSYFRIKTIINITNKYLKKNNNGPKTEACGTPDETSIKSEVSPFKITHWRRDDRYAFIHLNMAVSGFRLL